MLTRYCYTCHGNGAKSGGVALDAYKTTDAVDKDLLTWHTVLERVPARGKCLPTPQRCSL